MAPASAQPVYRSAAHRTAVMAHVGATLVPTALCFAVLAPLIGLALLSLLPVAWRTWRKSDGPT